MLLFTKGKPVVHYSLFSSLKGHPKGHFIVFSCTQGNPIGHCITYSLLEGHPRGHFIITSYMQAKATFLVWVNFLNVSASQRVFHNFFFYQPLGHSHFLNYKSNLSCFMHNRGTLEGTLSPFIYQGHFLSVLFSQSVYIAFF